jgi:phage regulator Rha-like protein
MPKRPSQLAISVESRILMLRHQRVILDKDLGELYGVTAKRLNEQVRRNRERFPPDFMFLLTAKEYDALRSQIATSKKGRGGRRYPPYAFTEHGAIMAATVLNSTRAVEMSVFVVRAFVRMREMLAKNRQLAAKINELDRRLETHDTAIQDIIEAIKELMVPESPVEAQDWLSVATRQELIRQLDALNSRGRVARAHINRERYLRRWRYKVPSTCFAIASTSNGSSRNLATLSAVSLGARRTAWYCTRFTFTYGLPLSQP